MAAPMPPKPAPTIVTSWSAISSAPFLESDSIGAPYCGAMRITKFGHACVRLETDGHVIVLDPGAFSEPEAVDGATAVLITHEHADHYSVDHLKRTDAPIHTIGAVAEQIRNDAPEVAERVHVVAPGDRVDTGVPTTVIGEKHAIIHADLPHID